VPEVEHGLRGARIVEKVIRKAVGLRVPEYMPIIGFPRKTLGADVRAVHDPAAGLVKLENAESYSLLSLGIPLDHDVRGIPDRLPVRGVVLTDLVEAPRFCQKHRPPFPGLLLALCAFPVRRKNAGLVDDPFPPLLELDLQTAADESVPLHVARHSPRRRRGNESGKKLLRDVPADPQHRAGPVFRGSAVALPETLTVALMEHGKIQTKGY